MLVHSALSDVNGYNL